MKTLLSGVAAIAMMGGTALAQGVVLVPQGQGPAGQQQYILVPVPQDDSAQQQERAAGQEARQRADAMALDLYRRGYQRGVADAQSRGGTFDPSAVEQIGRELFERGYMLGLMQAHARTTAQEMPDFGEQSQSGEAQGMQGAADLGIAGRTSGDEASQVLDGQPSMQHPPADLSIAGRMGGDKASEVFDGRASGPVITDGTQPQTAADLGVQGQLPAGQEASGAAGQQVTPAQIAEAASSVSGGQAGGQQASSTQGQDSAGSGSAEGTSGSAQASTGSPDKPQESSGQAATAEGQSPQAIIRTVEHEEHGKYLVDANGRPVYILEADKQGQGDTQPSSECQGACAEAWPPVLTQRTPPRAQGEADEGMLSTVERQDGTQQVTYNGWPLYYYVKDEAQVAQGSDARPTGHDVHDQWGGWYLLTPEGEQVQH